MKKILLVILVVLSTITLVGCFELEEIRKDRNEVKVSHTISVDSGQKDELGEIIYEEKVVEQAFLDRPINVVVFNYDILDILDSVGVKNAGIKMLGFPKSNIPASLASFDKKEYKNIGTLFVPNYDEIDLFNPELIIIGGRTQNLHDKFVKEYPNANVLDVSVEGTSYLADVSRNIANLRTIFPDVSENLALQMKQIKDEIELVGSEIKKLDIDAMFVLVNGKMISYYDNKGRFAYFYEEFGFKPVDVDSLGTGETHGGQMSSEQISIVNPKAIFVLDRSSTIGEEPAFEEFTKDLMIQKTLAYKNNNIFLLDGGAWYLTTGGVTATKQMAADVARIFGK